MKSRFVWLIAIVIFGSVLAGMRLTGVAQTQPGVQPARVERLQNLGVDADRSRRPVYLPAEWGHLVAVEKTGSLDYTLFLEAASGEIYLVRLVQNGDYLYLDTGDQGGVALVIERAP